MGRVRSTIIDTDGVKAMLFGHEHVEKYRETDGEVGHEWQDGVYTLLLTTTGHKTGQSYTTPLIYSQDGDDYIIIASKGGAPEDPDWYRNLQANPQVTIQVGSKVMTATGDTVTGDRRRELWSMMAEIWPQYDEYAGQTDRELPVVILRPVA